VFWFSPRWEEARNGHFFSCFFMQTRCTPIGHASCPSLEKTATGWGWGEDRVQSIFVKALLLSQKIRPLSFRVSSFPLLIISSALNFWTLLRLRESFVLCNERARKCELERLCIQPSFFFLARFFRILAREMRQSLNRSATNNLVIPSRRERGAG